LVHPGQQHLFSSIFFKINFIHARITKAIQDIAGRKVELDMKRMAAVIHREILDAMDKVFKKLLHQINRLTEIVL
jgi:effector-binding domain-containing protein